MALEYKVSQFYTLFPCSLRLSTKYLKAILYFLMALEYKVSQCYSLFSCGLRVQSISMLYFLFFVTLEYKGSQCYILLYTPSQLYNVILYFLVALEYKVSQCYSLFSCGLRVQRISMLYFTVHTKPAIYTCVYFIFD